MPEQPDAVEQALRSLRFRDRSTAELDRRLAQRGVGEAEREQALETLERIGYVDDERLARTRAEQLAGRGSGDALIRHDLQGRGIAPSRSRPRSPRSSPNGSALAASRSSGGDRPRRLATSLRGASARMHWKGSLRGTTEKR